MKKHINKMETKKYTTALSLTMMALLASGTVSANGEITLIGSVVPETCNLVPEVGGSVANTIQLGQAKVGSGKGDGVGVLVPFALTAKDGDAGCAGLIGGADNENTAEIAWTGRFNENGLETSVAGAFVELKAGDNSDNEASKKVMNASNLIANFDANLIDDGLQFTAQLISSEGALDVGNISVAAAYTVTYL